MKEENQEIPKLEYMPNACIKDYDYITLLHWELLQYVRNCREDSKNTCEHKVFTETFQGWCVNLQYSFEWLSDVLVMDELPEEWSKATKYINSIANEFLLCKKEKEFNQLAKLYSEIDNLSPEEQVALVNEWKTKFIN